MLHLIGIEANLRNIITVARPYLGSGDPGQLSQERVRQAFAAFLKDRGLGVGSTGLSWRWVNDLKEREELARSFGFRDPRSELYQHVNANGLAPAASAPEDDVLTEGLQVDYQRVMEGWKAVQCVDASLASIFELVVFRVCSTPAPRSPGSGSLPHLLGTIYINPETTWTELGIAECFVHEFTHELLWIDEHVTPHHPDAEAAYALGDVVPTAVRGDGKSINIVFSSIIVAAAVLQFRLQCPETPKGGPHGLTGDLAGRAMDSAAALRQTPCIAEYTTDRFWQLLDAAEAILAAAAAAEST